MKPAKEELSLAEQKLPPTEQIELSPEDELFTTIIERLLEKLSDDGTHLPTHDDLQAALEIAKAEVQRKTKHGETTSLKEELKGLYQGKLHNELESQANAMLSMIELAQRAHEELAEKEIDFLTGAFNRGKFYHDLSLLLNDRRENSQPFCLLMIDIDGFKLVNDKYGHGVGDKVLAKIAQRLNQILRGGDKLYRYGGDEFVVIIYGDLKEAKQLAERLLAEIKNTPIVLENQDEVRSSISIGVIHSTQVGNQITVEALTDLADRALFESKQSGKGKLTVHSYNN